VAKRCFKAAYLCPHKLSEENMPYFVDKIAQNQYNGVGGRGNIHHRQDKKEKAYFFTQAIHLLSPLFHYKKSQIYTLPPTFLYFPP
jgi:hypothetical protein